jgi:heme/copper-type cytochrome/quinol oxidase subunit 2
MLGWWLPENAFIDGGVFHLLYWSSAIAMLVVQVLLLRLRHPATKRDTRWREAVWAIVPVLLLLSLGVLSHRSANALAAPRPQIALENASPPSLPSVERNGR